MKTLSQHMEDYLRLRRQLGFKLHEEGCLLRNFVNFAREQRERFINTKLVS